MKRNLLVYNPDRGKEEPTTIETEFVVTFVDPFLSGWGPAEGKKNVVVVPCNPEKAHEIRQRLGRKFFGFKHFKIMQSKNLKNRPNVLYSLLVLD